MKFPPEQQTRMGFYPSSLPPVPTLMGSYPAAPPPPLEGLSSAAGRRSRPTRRTKGVSEIVDSILISASSISPRSGILCDADTSDRRVASSVPARMEDLEKSFSDSAQLMFDGAPAGSLYGERREKASAYFASDDADNADDVLQELMSKSAALELSVQEFAVPQGKPRKRRANMYSVQKRDCSVTDRSWSGYADKESEEPGLFSALRMKPAVATVGREALKLKWTKIFQMQHQDGYWEFTTELGEAIHFYTHVFANCYLDNKGINSLGVNARANILRLVATLLVLQLMRLEELEEGKLLRTLFCLDDSSQPRSKNRNHTHRHSNAKIFTFIYIILIIRATTINR